MRDASSRRTAWAVTIALIAAIFAFVPAPASATGPAAPTITSVWQDSGSAAGGDTITITGTNFVGTTSVSLGGVAAASFVVDSSTQISVLTPPGSAGSARALTVTAPGGTVTRSDAFTYYGSRTPVSTLQLDPSTPFPVQLAFSPDSRWSYVVTDNESSVLVLDSLGDTPTLVDTISVGTYAIGVDVARTGSRVYAFSKLDTWIASIAIDGNTRTLTDTKTVGMTDMSSSRDGQTLYVTHLNKLLSLDPATKNANETLTLSATADAVAVSPTGSTLFVLHAAANLLSIVGATGPLSVMETVTVGAGPTSLTVSSDGMRAFVVNGTDGSVSIVQRVAGSPSTVATVTGLPNAWEAAVTPDDKWVYVTNGTNNVFWQINAATGQVVDAIGVDAVVHPDNTLYGLAVSPDGNYTYIGHYYHSRIFSFRNPPSITSVTPATSTTAGGTSVTINGFGFTGATSVTIGGVLAETQTVAATQITAITPPGTAGAVSIVVTGPGGSDTKTAAFTYVAPTPPSTPAPAPAPVAASAGPVASLTSITPSTGPTAGGTQVTITGSNLGSVNGVTFNGNPATSLTVVDSTRITAVTPAGVAGPANVMLSMPGSTASFGAGFTYVAPTTPTTDAGTSGGSTTSSGTATAGGSATTTTTTAVRAGAALATFATKSSILSATDRKTIQRLVITSGMDARYRIKGYITTSASAQTLARARARAVQRLLIELGVAYSRISTEFNSKVAKQVQLVALTDR